MSTLQHPPPTCFLHEIIDYRAKYNPSESAFIAVNETDPNNLTHITYLEASRSCHRAALILRPTAEDGNNNQVVALLVNTDSLVCFTLFMGLVLAGFVPFPISPRFTPAAIVHLLQKVGCNRVLATESNLQDLLAGVRAEWPQSSSTPLIVEDVPPFEQLFPHYSREKEEDPFTPYVSPFPTRQLSDIGFYLHSSGSTGRPKAIAQTHEVLRSWVEFPTVADMRDYPVVLRLSGHGLPFFHLLGAHLFVFVPYYSGVPIGIFPVKAALTPGDHPLAPSPALILEHTRKTGCNVFITVPMMLQHWSRSPDAVQFLKTLEFIIYAGGPLAPAIAQGLVDAGVKMVPGYGGTEFGGPVIAFDRAREYDKDDWSWCRFSHKANIRWIPQGNNIFELQLLTSKAHKLAVHNLPDVEGYATSDLWEKHPTREGLWRMVGRIDDVILHSSGEKTVPGPMEAILNSSPLIDAAIIFGQQYEHTGVLIEPSSKVGDTEEFVDQIWPLVEEANKMGAEFSRIFKEMIILVRPDKRLPRTAKGTISRKEAVVVYKDEIESAYTSIQSNIQPPKDWTVTGVQEWLCHELKELAQGKPISLEDDLFAQGLDSLSAISLRHRLNLAMRKSFGTERKPLPQNLVYQAPTIIQLSQRIVGLLEPDTRESSGVGASATEADIMKMMDMFGAK